MTRTWMVLLAGLALVPGVFAEPRAAAPDFALRSTAGDNVRLSEYRGQGVVIAFWATRCALCTPQVTLLDDLTTSLEGRGVRLLVVSIDRNTAAGDGLARQLTAPVLLDPERAVARRYSTGQLPYAVFVDPHGRVRETAAGGARDWAAKHERAVLALMDEWMVASGWKE